MAEIDVGKFSLNASASPKKADGAPCVGSVTGSLHSFTCTVNGKKETYPKTGEGEQEKEVTDPAEWLRAMGWTVSAPGFSREGHFDALHVEVDFEASCACADDFAKNRKRKFRCSIDYDRDGTGGPKFKIVELDDSGNPKREDKSLKPKGDQKEYEPGGAEKPTYYDVTQVSEATIGCLCDLDNPCHVSITLNYTYTIG
jgi:hypothetical protein